MTSIPSLCLASRPQARLARTSSRASQPRTALPSPHVHLVLAAVKNGRVQHNCRAHPPSYIQSACVRCLRACVPQRRERGAGSRGERKRPALSLFFHPIRNECLVRPCVAGVPLLRPPTRTTPHRNPCFRTPPPSIPIRPSPSPKKAPDVSLYFLSGPPPLAWSGSTMQWMHPASHPATLRQIPCRRFLNIERCTMRAHSLQPSRPVTMARTPSTSKPP